MAWVSVVLGAMGLAREIIKYINEKEACSRQEKALKLKAAKDRVRSERQNLHGSADLVAKLSASTTENQD